MSATLMDRTCLVPEAVRSLGTPWVLSHDVSGERKDGMQWPMAGFGHVLSTQRGEMIVCFIPVEQATERGGSMDSCVTFVGQLQWAEFEHHVYILSSCLVGDTTSAVGTIR